MALGWSDGFGLLGDVKDVFRLNVCGTYLLGCFVSHIQHTLCNIRYPMLFCCVTYFSKRFDTTE